MHNERSYGYGPSQENFKMTIKSNLTPLLSLICTVLLPGCIMIMPGLKNDFSTLKDDAISNFLRQTLKPQEDKPDLAAFQKKSADFFHGESSELVKAYFASNDGDCHSSENKNELFCQCTREWRYINSYQMFFGLFDTIADDADTPKAMFSFIFKLNNNLIEHTKVEYKNLTYY